MLGDLLGVPAATIRRWHRIGLIQPRQTVHRLPYFAFEEIAVARRLVELAENGESSELIEARLRELARHWPGVNRPLAQLALVVEGRRLLVKRDGETLEPSGQKRLSFEGDREAKSDEPTTIPLRAVHPNSPSHTPEQALAMAEELDDAGDDASAADMYRAALAAGGPTAEINFQLAECLYRLGELAAARERYSIAVEIDDHFVEARANLGCVLAELGQAELAIAALQGVLALSDHHADAHYHLARLHDAAGNSAQADLHRERFQQLMPASPWATEALGS